MLQSFGVPVEEHDDGLTIHGDPYRPLEPGRVDASGDHRIAMCGAILARHAGSDTRSILTDNPTAAQLRGYIDMLADHGVDIFAHDIFQKQGVTWFDPEHPDHAHKKTQVDGISKEDGPPIAIAIGSSIRKTSRAPAVIADSRMARRST